MHGLDDFALLLAGGHVRLVGDDDIQETRVAQALKRFGNAWEDLQFRHRVRRIRFTFSDNSPIYDPVAVEKDRALAYHLVAICCRAGWETRQCQTTAWKASVCGVTRDASTVGITTTQSPICLV